MHAWSSFMAIGDSFTEGLEDATSEDGGYRGWADRLAATLAEDQPGLSYANLGIRGDEMTDVEVNQLPVALGARPDLVSMSAGGNDLIKPGSDVDELARRFNDMVAQVRAAGSDVLIFTGQDTKTIPVLSFVRAKIAIYNGHLRAIADRHGCYVVDLWGMPVLRDRRAWAVDRLHLSPQGHHLVALKAAEVLGLAPAGASEAEPWPPQAELRWWDARRSDLTWARAFLVPWARRQLRGESLGDGLSPKRPVLAPLTYTNAEVAAAATREQYTNADRPVRDSRVPADQTRWQIPRVASPAPPEAPDRAG